MRRPALSHLLYNRACKLEWIIYLTTNKLASMNGLKRRITDRRLKVFCVVVMMLIDRSPSQAETNSPTILEKGSSLLSGSIKSAKPFSVAANDKPNVQGQLEVKEVPLAKVPKDMRREAIPDRVKDWNAYSKFADRMERAWFERFEGSPDRRRVVFVDHQDDGWVAIIDGKPGKKYDAISNVNFSPDSKRVAYCAEQNGSKFLVVDRVESKPYSRESDMYAIFSPDSQRVAFMARKAGRNFVVIDGVEGKPYASIRKGGLTPIFSPNSKRFAYAAEISDEKWVMVLDGVESKTYGGVDDPFFSPDSQHVMFKAWRNSRELVVIDGVEGPEVDGLVHVPIGPGAPFSPDSKRTAYSTLGRGKEFVIADGKAGPEYDHVKWDSLFFSSKSQLAYSAKTGNDAFVVVDDKVITIPGHKGMDPAIVFSPDGTHVAYVGSRGLKSFVVLDGAEGAPTHNTIPKPVFSPDSKRLAYAQNGFSATVVVDGKPGPKHAIGEISDLIFSPDSQHVAYRVYMSFKVSAARVVIDGQESPLWGDVEFGSLSFSPDSKHVAYWATPLSSSGHKVVVGNLSTPAYPDIPFQTRPVFDGKDSLHALAIRGEDMLLLQIKIPSAEKSGKKTNHE